MHSVGNVYGSIVFLGNTLIDILRDSEKWIGQVKEMFDYFYMQSGAGYGAYRLTSFDDALLRSGVGNYNLLRVSSLLPAGCRQVSSVDVEQGSGLHIAYAAISTNRKQEPVASAVAVGIPADKSHVGVIMECSAHTSEEQVKKMAESMVIEAMKKRGYAIREILATSCGAVSSGGEYVTAFSGLAMW